MSLSLLAAGRVARANFTDTSSAHLARAELAEPRPGDVASIDGIIAAFYAASNSRAGEPGQSSRARTLFSPWIRIVGSYATGSTQVCTPQDFMRDVERMLQGDFAQREIHRDVRRYGNVANVESTYEALFQSGTAFRGITHLQVYFDGQRWWIASVIWQAETAEFELPARGSQR